MSFAKKAFDIGVSSLIILGMGAKFIIEKSFELYKDSDKRPKKKYKQSSANSNKFNKNNYSSSSSKPKKNYKETASYKEKQKIKANIDALYIKLNEAYSAVNEISDEIDGLYSSWRSVGIKSHHGDSNEAKEMYSLKNERDSCYSNIKDIK